MQFKHWIALGLLFMVVAATSGNEVLCNCAVCDPKRCDCGCLEAAAERVKRQDDILLIDDETVPAPPPAKESSDVVSPRGRGRPQGPRFALNRPGPRQNRRNQQAQPTADEQTSE